MEHTLASALGDIRGIKVDEGAVRAHAIRPSHVQDVISSRGLEEGKAHIASPFPATTVFPTTSMSTVLAEPCTPG